MTYNQEQIRSRAINFSNQGFSITDPNQPDNPIVDINEAFTLMTGYTPEDILGKNCRFLQGKSVNQENVTLLRDAIANRKSITVLLENYRKDGSMFWNELSVSPVFDNEGSLIYFVGIQQDVTREQTLLHDIKHKNDELETFNAMMVDRELKMVELKKEIEELKKSTR